MGFTAEVKLAIGRIRAIEKCPYFSTALMALVPRETTTITQTMCTTEHGIMFWNRTFIDTLSPGQTAGLLIHELSHVLRLHCQRCRASGADPVKMNIAQDAEINDDIVAMRMELPPNPILPALFGMPDGKTAEEYYAKYPHSAFPKQPENPMCGSAAGNPPPGEPDDDADPSARSLPELAVIRAQTAQAIQTHIQQNGRGSVPGNWGDWANVSLTPARIPWTKKLARACRAAVAFRAGAVVHVRNRMSRRQAAIGYGAGKPVLAALRAPVPNVLIALDDSGSMGHGNPGTPLARAVSECVGIFKATGTSVAFIACDAAVHADTRVSNVKDLLRNMKGGGGGTDFVPVFDAIASRRNKPAVLIFLTDGDGRAPAVAPKDMTVIWVLVGSSRREPTFGDYNNESQTWGTMIYVDNER